MEVTSKADGGKRILRPVHSLGLAIGSLLEAAAQTHSFLAQTPDGFTASFETTGQPPMKNPSSLVIRLTKSDRSMLNKLSNDYGQSMVTVLAKSLRLYRAIVEAGEQGGKLIMVNNQNITTLPVKRQQLLHQTSVSRVSLQANDYGDDSIPRVGQSVTSEGCKMAELQDQRVSAHVANAYEAALAVREPFAELGKSPITLNRIYIPASKGLKTERIAIRAESVFMDTIVDLEKRTGLTKSTFIRDSLHLYNFVKRESEKGLFRFYVGSLLVEGI
jgi:hypothetical protein